MGKLERAKIYVLESAGETRTANDAQSGIDVCFNPKEYSLEKSVSWESEKAFSDAPIPEFKSPSPMTLSVTLQFDTYEERVSVREKYVKKLEALAMMKGQLGKKASKEQKQKARPPAILFVWGRFSFQGVVESLSQKYTMFLSDGTPVRAECGLKIRQVGNQDVNDDKSSSFSASSGSTTQYTVKDGDRLDLIAAKELGDASRWPEIAALNDIVDASTMDKKTSLTLPPK